MQYRHIGLYIVIFIPQMSSPVFAPKLLGQTTPILLPLHPLARTQKLPTPVRVDRLKHMLFGYDHSTAEFLIGFSRGFSIHLKGSLQTMQTNNLISALHNPVIVHSKIQKELEAHRLAGPFASPSFQPLHVSPLGVVPKKAPGEFHLIHHLSFPKGSSVNDGIHPDHTQVCYARVEDAIQQIKEVGKVVF